MAVQRLSFGKRLKIIDMKNIKTHWRSLWYVYKCQHSFFIIYSVLFRDFVCNTMALSLLDDTLC